MLLPRWSRYFTVLFAVGSLSSLAPLRASGWCQMIASAAKRFSLMICVQVSELPLASVALYVRMIVIGEVPETASPTCMITGFESRSSETLPPAKSAGGTLAAHCTVTAGGQVIVGGAVSDPCHHARLIRNSEGASLRDE